MEANGLITDSSGCINNRKRGLADDGLEFEDELDEDGDEFGIKNGPSATKVPAKQACYAIYRKIQHGSSSKLTSTDIDFKHELQYVLSTVYDDKSTLNLRNLGLLQLVKKSINPEFRNFLRAQKFQLDKLFTVLMELTNSSSISLSTACLLYFMTRDRKSIPVTELSIRLISELLKQDQQLQRQKSDDSYNKHFNSIWSILQDWLHLCKKKAKKAFKFDICRDNLSTGTLTLEALAYIAAVEQGKLFKQELLNSGALTNVVAKLDKLVLELVHSASISPEDLGHRFKVVECCYRIMENAAAFDKRNQIFLIQHRNSLLIFSSSKFLNFALKFIGNCSQSDFNEQKVTQVKDTKVFDCICLLCRVLMNISHENENASQKIGQVAGLLGNCLSLLAHYSQFAPKEKFSDVSVMMYGLLVNLLERCATNRRKFVSLKTTYLEKNGEDGVTTLDDVSSLEALTKLFIKHDLAAKSIDEELDNELAGEEPGGEEDDGEGGNGRTHARVASMSQDEIMAAIEAVTAKASTHMEDSMIASYCSLVVAILVGADEKLADQVRAHLPGRNMAPMVEQLERFLDFMRITNLKANVVANIERVFKTFQETSTGP